MNVSLVIPAYNEAANLRKCLDSVATQTIKPFEVIIVDNNSTDGTADLASSYPFTKVIKESVQGRVYARDAGFNKAKGDVIARVDADTVLPDNWIKYITTFYESLAHQKSAFTGDADFHNVRFPKAVSWLYRQMSFNLNHLLIGHPTLWGSNMAITRNQWEDVKALVCQRNDIHEDLDLSIHIKEAGNQIVYDHNCHVKAELRRVYSDRHELFEYLQWWPRTLKSHGKLMWPVCWLISVVPLYCLTLVLIAADKIARLSGKKSLA